MAEYVDGFVVPAKRDRIEEYREIAAKAASSGASLGRSTTRSASPTTSRPAR